MRTRHEVAGALDAGRLTATNKGTAMRRPSRIRRRLKWTGLVACAMLVVAWVTSLRFGVSWQTSDGCEIEVGAGCLRICATPFRMDERWWPTIYDSTAQARWRGWLDRCLYVPSGQTRGTWGRCFVAPLWCLLVVGLIPTLFLWWRDRPLPPDYCQRCGYNLTGNISGRCPECGTQIAESQRALETPGTSS